MKENISEVALKLIKQKCVPRVSGIDQTLWSRGAH